MGNMNIMGSYSGIGMDTVDQLIEAEKSRGVQFTNKKSKIESQQTAWKDVSTRLDSLYKNIEKLQNPETFQSQTVKSSIKESPFLSVTGNTKAAAGQYRVKVKQLASASRLTGERIKTPELTEAEIKKGTTSLDKPFLKNDGTLSFDSVAGKETTKITINKEDSLKDIAGKINKETKNSGVQASIVDNHLILTDTELGDRDITIKTGGANDLAGQLGFVVTKAPEVESDDPKIGSTIEAVKGDQSIVFIDGLEIRKNSNQIDVIEGLTINLTDVHEGGKSELITVEQDTEKTVEVVKEFIKEYNSIMSFIDKQTDFGDPSLENNKSGALAGESSVIRLQSGLRSLLTGDLKGASGDDIKNLGVLGIEVDRYGVATVDEAELTKAIQDDPANVGRFFYQPATAGVEGAEGAAGEKTPKSGMSELLKNFVDSYNSSSKGIIKTRQESNDRMLKDIEKQIETFNKRIDKKRDRYIREFTALDQAMMQAESQLDFLYSQLGME